MLLTREFRNMKPTLEELAMLQGRWREHPRYRGCQADYMMVESGGSLVVSLSGLYHGTATAGTTRPIGKFGHAVSFTPNNFIDSNTLTMGNTNLFCDATDRFSVVIWLNMAAATQGTIIGKAGPTFGDRTFQVLYGASANQKPQCLLRGSTTDTNAGLNDDLWHQMAVTWNGTTASFYADGTFRTTLSVGTAALETTQRVIMGARTNGTGFFLTGQIDLCRVYDVALSDQDILSLFFDPFLEYRWASEQTPVSYFFMPDATVSPSSYYYHLVG